MLEVTGKQRGQGQLGEPLEAGKAQVRVEEHHGRDHHRGEEGQRGRGRHAQRGRVILARGGACKYRVTTKRTTKISISSMTKYNYCEAAIKGFILDFWSGASV